MKLAGTKKSFQSERPYPVSGTDDEFNPIYIVVEYESEDDEGEKEYIAGGRVGYTSDDENIKVGMSYLRESTDEQLVVVDASYNVNEEVKLKAEVAQSVVGNKIVYTNDLVFNKLKAHLGVFFKSTIPFKGLVSPDYAVYKSIGKIKDLKYLELLYRHPAYISQFISKATGIVEGLIRLYSDDLFSIKVPIPPIKEQDEILTHIETQSTKIDQSIALQQKQIAKLKEYKSVLIDSAVTGKVKV